MRIERCFYFCNMKDEELQILQRYFPAAAVPMVAEAYTQSRFQLKFKKPRNSKLGDFRPPQGDNGVCCITLNGNLNPYQMLVMQCLENVFGKDLGSQIGKK